MVTAMGNSSQAASSTDWNMDFARIVEAVCVTSPHRVILCRRFYPVHYFSSDTVVNMMVTFYEGLLLQTYYVVVERKTR